MPNRNFQVKPPLGSQLNFSHPLSQGLVGCWLMNEGGGNLVNDSIKKYNLVKTGGKWGSNIESGFIHDGQNTTKLSWQTEKNIVLLPPFTSLIRVVAVQSGIIQTFSSNYEGVTEKYQIAARSGTVGIYGEGGTQYGNLAINVITKKPVNLIGVFYAPNLRRFYMDLNKAPDNTGFLHINYISRFTVGFNQAGGYPEVPPSGTNFIMACYWNRALSPSEIQQLYINPYCFIKPRTSIFAYGTAGEPEPPPSTVTPYGYLSCNKGWW